MKKLQNFTAGFVICTILLGISASAAFAQIGSGGAPPTAAQTDKFPTLTWNSSGAGITYNVYRGVVTSGPKGKINSTPVAASTYRDTTASFGTLNFYSVTAVRTSDGVESVQSNEVSATSTQGSPSAPTGVNVVVAALIKVAKVIFAGLKFLGTFGGKLG